ncbi:polysaccharide pyruvyl transferase family protein [Cryobacterium sp. Hb1]|uniref:polysaccharide pyruvyl transferase family protein n=1 Tax=Cryobacterium sp. Hb1 TaxID=1259147 RepID=UPI00106D2771|nr:polysaccharide pyruvyl transferase family protein [Cryobacterium sp. Hb1]TFD68559.1 polysaccharide pyruvyl transferase family protein [Cryobacterium sp. Hb1]
MSNYGDDLFCEVWLARGDVLLPGLDIHIVGHNPRIGARVFSSNTRVGSIWRAAMGINAVLRAHIIVLGGGSVLSDISGVRRLQWRFSKCTRTAFQSLGVSVGPFTTEEHRNTVSAFLNDNERVVVRDKTSVDSGLTMDLPQEIGMGGDLAALHPRAGIRHRVSDGVKSDRRVVGLALCRTVGFGNEATDRLVRALAIALDSTRTMGITDHITVISLNGHSLHGDEEISTRAVNLLLQLGLNVNLVRYGDLGVVSTWTLLASFDAVVAVRLHGAISAYLAYVPFVLVEYHQKCTDFSIDIGQDPKLVLDSTRNQEQMERSITTLLTDAPSPLLAPLDYILRAERAYLPSMKMGE